MLLAAASMGVESSSLNKFIEQYRNSMFGGHDSNKDFIEKYADLIEDQSMKEMYIKREKLPGER